MGNFRSSYELDLSSTIEGFKTMQREVDDFNKATSNSKKVGEDAYKGFTSAADKHTKAILDSVKATEKIANSQKAFKEEAKRLDTVLQQLQKSTKAFIAAGKYDELQKKIAEVKKRQAELRGEIDKTGQSSSKMGELAGKATAFIGGLFVVEKAVDFVKAVFNVTAEFQKYQAVLTNTTGSSRLAKLAMAELKDIAATTPFSVAELTASYVKLRNAGINPTKADIIALGDVAASQGKSFDQLTEAIIDAQTGEFERLKEFGIRASKEGDKVAFSFKGQTVEVKNTADAIKEYITGLGKLEGVAGGMAAQSATLGGQLSNLGDSFDSLFSTIGAGTSGVMAFALKKFNEYIGWVTDALKSVDQIQTESIGRQVGRFMEVFRDSDAVVQKYIKINLARNINETTRQLDTLTAKYDEVNEAAKKWALAGNFYMQAKLLKDNESLLQEKENAETRLEFLKTQFDAVQAYQKEQKDAAQRAADEQAKLDKEAAEKRRKELEKQLKELQKLEEDLQKQATKARLEILDKDSREYLDELFNQGEKEIDLIRQKLIEQGKLTSANFKLTADQESQLQLLRDANAKQYVDSIDDLTKKQSEAYKKQNEDRKKKADEALKLEEQIEIERIKAIQGKNLDKSQEAIFEEQKQKKILAVQVEYAKKRLQLLEGTAGPEMELQKLQLQNLISELEKEISDFKPKEGAEKKFDLFALFGLDLNDDEKEGIMAAFNEIGGAVQNLLATQIEASNQLIAQKDKELEQRQRSLDQQIELNKQGFASDVEGERAKIREIEKERNQAIQRQRAAQKAQLLADSVSQLSSLITASANIFKVTSPILPPFGQILAIGAIATMFGAFIGAKAKAFQAAGNAPSFRKGGGLMLNGATHEEGGIHLMDSKTGKKLAEYEGNEYLFAVNKASSKKHQPLLDAINEDDFSKLHFNNASLRQMLEEAHISPAPELPGKVRKLQTKISKAENKRASQVEQRLIKVESLLNRIASGTDNIPDKTIEYLPNGDRIERTKNSRRLIRKVA